MSEYELFYEGKLISTNQAKAFHWRKLKKLVDALKARFTEVINEVNPPKFKQFEIEVEFWSRFDCDNTVFSIKIMVDALVNSGYLIDDNKNHWRKLTVTAKKGMKNNTILFKIKKVKL